MASIGASIELYDKISAPLNKMVAALHSSVNAFENLSNVINNGLDSTSIEEVETAVRATNVATNDLSNMINNTSSYINNNTYAQEEFNEAINQGVNNSNKLNSIISKAASALGAFFGIRQIYRFAKNSMSAFDTQLKSETQLMTVLSNILSDDYILSVTADNQKAIDNINDIQNSIEPIVITPEVRAQALQNEFDKISSKAKEIQSKGMYGDEIMLAGAAELTTYFSDTKAIEMMMDTLANYAAGMSMGEELDAQAMTDYATGLGKIMNGSYENMTRKGFTFTDAQKAVIEGTATQSEYIQVLGEDYQNMTDDVRSAAAITQVIDEYWANMYNTMSNTPQGAIIQLKNAWGDLTETIGQQLYPYVLQLMNTIRANWPAIENIINGFISGIKVILASINILISGLVTVADFIKNNWSIIQPIILGIASALAIYNGILIAHKLFLAMCTIATQTWVTVQKVLNATLLASPLTMIAIVIGTVIALIYILCRQIAKTSDVANNAFSVMTGGINIVIEGIKNLGLVIANIGIAIWNSISAICQNIGAAFHNVISNVQSWWYNLLSTVLNVISGIAAALNKLPFIEFDYSGITAKADDFANKSAKAAGNMQDYTSVTDAFSQGMSTYSAFQKGWSSQAFASGAEWGNNISDKISSYLSKTIPNLDASSFLNDINSYDASQIPSNIADTAGNTARAADSLSITDDDLKYLRDIAERDVVNKFTTAEIRVDMGGITNNVNSETDLDGIINYLASGIQNAMETAAEGVHA